MSDYIYHYFTKINVLELVKDKMVITYGGSRDVDNNSLVQSFFNFRNLPDVLKKVCKAHLIIPDLSDVDSAVLVEMLKHDSIFEQSLKSNIAHYVLIPAIFDKRRAKLVCKQIARDYLLNANSSLNTRDVRAQVLKHLLSDEITNLSCGIIYD